MGIADFNHRIFICTSRVDVVGDSNIELQRAIVFDTWAHIQPKKRSTFSRDGYAVMDDANRVTHRITIPWRPDIDYSVSAWIYEELLMGSPKWFKIIGEAMSEDGQYSEIDALLYERSSSAVKPSDDLQQKPFAATQLPKDIKL